MNLAQQRRVIAVSAMMVFALGALSHAQKGELPTARFLIGTGGIFTVISFFADMGLPIGAAMAIVVTLTSVLTEGEGVINLLAARSGPSGSEKRFAKDTKGIGNKIVKQPEHLKVNGKEVAGTRTTPVKPLGIKPKQVGF